MGLSVTFENITELFANLFEKFADTSRPLMMRKIGKTYQPISYSEARDTIHAFALGLSDLGISAGDKVAILSENRPEWVYTDVAALALGCADVPIFPSQTAKQVEFILKDSVASVIVVSNAFQLTKVLKIRSEVPKLRHVIVMNEPAQEQDGVISFSSVVENGKKKGGDAAQFLRDAARRTTGEQLCTIIYTSGTTGNPKGVMLTHRNFVSNITSASQLLPIGTEDVLLSFLPLCHSFERMAGYYTAMGCGATIAYAESVETVAENLLEVRPTLVCSVPRLFERIHTRIARKIEKEPTLRKKIFYWAVKVGHDSMAARRRKKNPPLLSFRYALADKLVFSKLRERTGGRIRYFVSGGAALPRDLAEFFEAVGILIMEGYGLTETSPVISVNMLDGYKFGSVGKPIPGVEVKISEDGEILTRGPHVMAGYYNDKKATEEMIDSEGWLHTGDIGMMDQDGYLYITDRKKHLFVSSGGKNIAPQPIENLFAANDFIDQFILIGDKRMYLTALIVPDYDALKEYADKNGIPYKDKRELVNNHEISMMIEQKIQSTQKDLANFEKVRRFTLLEAPLTIESGELTPTMKIRRKAVEERYKDLIEAMYQT